MATTPDLKTLTTPSLIWAQHQHAHAMQRITEQRNRSDAFFDDVAPVVCGVAIRILRPDDLLVLDRLGNPLVCGGAVSEVTPEHVAQFLWALALDNRDGWLNPFRMGRMVGRLRKRDHLENVAECLDYIDAIFQDAPAPTHTKPDAETSTVREPIGAHFLASILVSLSCDVGPVDPLDGRPWQVAPLPRIFQYLKVARARKDSEFSDDSPHKLHEAAWLAEVNEARRRGVLVGEQGIPGSRGLEHISAAEVAEAQAA